MLTATEESAPVTLSLHTGQSVIHRSPARFRVVVTGRRWGKTTLDKAEAMVEFGTPGLVWYLAPTYDMARDLMWEPMRQTVPRSWLVKDPNESRMEMETIWGCRFACKSVERPDRLRGRGPRKIIGDEFQDWPNGQQTWEEVLLPSLLTTHGAALLTGTPKSFNHLYDAYRKGQDGINGWASWQFRTSDAPHIDKVFLAQMRAEMDPRAYRQEFEASFEALAGRAYYAFARDHHVGAVELERSIPACVSFDFNINPATFVIGQKVRDEARIWREGFITHAGGEATLAAATGARDALAAIGWNGGVRIFGDATGQAAKTTGPSDHAVIKAVFPGATWCIKSENPHVKDRVAAVNSRCETMDGQRHLRVDPSCKRLIADFEQVIFLDNGELDKKTNALLTHISDAGGYWIAQDFPLVKPAINLGSARIDYLL